MLQKKRNKKSKRPRKRLERPQQTESVLPGSFPLRLASLSRFSRCFSSFSWAFFISFSFFLIMARSVWLETPSTWTRKTDTIKKFFKKRTKFRFFTFLLHFIKQNRIKGLKEVDLWRTELLQNVVCEQEALLTKLHNEQRLGIIQTKQQLKCKGFIQIRLWWICHRCVNIVDFTMAFTHF